MPGTQVVVVGAGINGFVKDGIWRLTEELARINLELGVDNLELNREGEVLPQVAEAVKRKCSRTSRTKRTVSGAVC